MHNQTLTYTYILAFLSLRREVGLRSVHLICAWLHKCTRHCGSLCVAVVRFMLAAVLHSHRRVYHAVKRMHLLHPNRLPELIALGNMEELLKLKGL